MVSSLFPLTNASFFPGLAFLSSFFTRYGVDPFVLQGASRLDALKRWRGQAEPGMPFWEKWVESRDPGRRSREMGSTEELAVYEVGRFSWRNGFRSIEAAEKWLTRGDNDGTGTGRRASHGCRGRNRGKVLASGATAPDTGAGVFCPLLLRAAGAALVAGVRLLLMARPDPARRGRAGLRNHG